MTAIWLVGAEHPDPRECGEICVAEIGADAVALQMRTRCGIKAHHDDRLTTGMITTTVPYDSGRSRTESVEWGGGVTVIGCKNRVIAAFTRAQHTPRSAMLRRAKAWSRLPLNGIPTG